MSADGGKRLFEQFYIRMVLDSASKFGVVLRAIESSDRPVMFHCTGGRDRTGITAALLLQVLGVSREAILSDFVLSTKYLTERTAATPSPTTELDAQKARLYAEVFRLQPAISRRYSKRLTNATAASTDIAGMHSISPKLTSRH